MLDITGHTMEEIFDMLTLPRSTKSGTQIWRKYIRCYLLSQVFYIQIYKIFD